jgi:ribonucleoside-diphosphate reductase alpha chain
MATDTIEEKLGNSYVPEGLTFTRHYTQDGINPLDQIKYATRQSKILNRETGEILFQLDNVQAPESWSQLAVDIAAEKYFREPEHGVETSVRGMVERVADAIYMEGVKRGYFATEKDGETFRAELSHLLINQKASFNSPVWFNVGLAEKYGIKGETSGNWAYDTEKGEVVPVSDSYSRPQASACFIQSVEDSLLNGENSMIHLQASEVRLFKQGSGTGTNFSPVRGKGEKLSGGGYSSGLVSFLNGFNAWGGATKSGGTTRRAAKMVTVNQDHPDIFEFVDWKLTGEMMARDLIRAGWPRDYEAIVYSTVPGQNSNNSVRLTDEFMNGLQDPNATFKTINRVGGQVRAEHKVKDLWDAIINAAYECGDPGLQFDTTINDWHTSAASGRINGSNPCSEYMFLDDTSCNLASINLVKFMREDGTFDIGGYKHAVDVVITAQEILVTKASYPTQKAARNSEDFRPLGLGYANLGAMLMRLGIPYDSDEAETITGGLTAILTGEAYLQSAKIAGTNIGPFNAYEKNKESFIRVMEKHRQKVDEIKKSSGSLEYLVESAKEVWNQTVEMVKQNGGRNAQASVIAPTGTIGLVMDCDTTGIEPDYAYVKYKKLAGGGFAKIVNQSIPAALARLGYDENTTKGIVTHIVGHLDSKGEGNPQGAPHLREEHYSAVIAAKEKGRPEALEKLGYNLSQVNDIVNYIDGHKTIEGAPGFREDHLAIFDTANKAGEGKRFIQPMGHVRIVAAAQPFISGAISKTINMPNEATKEDIAEVYNKSWIKKLKAVALYRDGSKWSQPLNTGRHEDVNLEDEVLLWGQRKMLEDQREGITQKFKIGGTSFYVRTGEYDDGTLGEIFLDAHQGGSEWKTAIQMLSHIASKAIQYGMPVEEIVDDFTHIQAQPRGVAEGDKNIRMVSSMYDFVGRLIGVQYLGRTDLATEPDRVDEKELRYYKNERVRKALAALDELEKGNALIIINNNGSEEKGDKSHKKPNNTIHFGPPCKCGGTTIKTGTCFTCTNCGANGGCG